MPLTANTEEEAGQYIGLHCHVNSNCGESSPTKEDFEGTLVAWVAGPFGGHKWLVHSEGLNKQRMGHDGESTHDVRMGSRVVGMAYGHWFCTPNQTTLLSTIKVRGNEIYMEEYDASSTDQD